MRFRRLTVDHHFITTNTVLTLSLQREWLSDHNERELTMHEQAMKRKDAADGVDDDDNDGDDDSDDSDDVDALINGGGGGADAEDPDADFNAPFLKRTFMSTVVAATVTTPDVFNAWLGTYFFSFHFHSGGRHSRLLSNSTQET
jgi:hypothetical protein